MGSAGSLAYIGIVPICGTPPSTFGPSSPRLGAFLSSICKEAALLLKTSLIAAAVAMTVPAYALQPQRGIRIITPYGEHMYSADPAAPGWLPDDENLRLQNERERAQVMRQLERDREAAARQQALDAENSN
jgi:hypothetical protein